MHFRLISYFRLGIDVVASMNRSLHASLATRNLSMVNKVEIFGLFFHQRVKKKGSLMDLITLSPIKMTFEDLPVPLMTGFGNSVCINKNVI